MLYPIQILGGRSAGAYGKGKSHLGPVKYGFSLVKGKANHPMEDYHVAKFVQVRQHELGLFAIYDGHLGDSVPAYLQKHLFSNIIKQVGSYGKLLDVNLFVCCFMCHFLSVLYQPLSSSDHLCLSIVVR